MKRSRRAIWNYASSLLFTVVTLIVGLKVSKLVLQFLGEERFGAFRMMFEWNGYLILLELGLSGALTPHLARQLAQSDEEAIRRTLVAGIRSFFRVVLSMMAVGLLVEPVITWLIPVEPSLRHDLRMAWLCCLAGSLLLWLSPFKVLAEARQQGYLVQLSLTAQFFVVSGLSLFLAWRGWGIAGQAIGLASGALVPMILMGWYGERLFPGTIRQAIFTPADPALKAQLSSLGWVMLTLQVCGRVSTMSDLIIAGMVIGPSFVPILYATRRLAELGTTQLQAVGTATWPGLSELHNQGEKEQFQHRLVEMTRLIVLMGMAGLVPIVAYNHHFVRMWVGAEFDGGPWMAVVVALDALVVAVLSLWGLCFIGTGHARTNLPIVVIGAAANVGLSVLFAFLLKQYNPVLGTLGPPLGTLFSFGIARLWYTPLLLKRTFGIPLGELALATLPPFVWGVAYAIPIWYVAHTHTPRGWFELIGEAVLAALGFLVLAAVMILSPRERALWQARLLSVLPRPKVEA